MSKATVLIKLPAQPPLSCVRRGGKFNNYKFTTKEDKQNDVKSSPHNAKLLLSPSAQPGKYEP
jgi:hypothetical protein